MTHKPLQFSWCGLKTFIFFLHALFSSLAFIATLCCTSRRKLPHHFLTVLSVLNTQVILHRGISSNGLMRVDNIYCSHSGSVHLIPHSSSTPPGHRFCLAIRSVMKLGLGRKVKVGIDHGLGD